MFKKSSSHAHETKSEPKSVTLSAKDQFLLQALPRAVSAEVERVKIEVIAALEQTGEAGKHDAHAAKKAVDAAELVVLRGDIEGMLEELGKLKSIHP